MFNATLSAESIILTCYDPHVDYSPFDNKFPSDKYIIPSIPIDVCAVQIIEEPQDQFVSVGRIVFFNCTYIESYSIPQWVINGAAYSANALPRRHSYSYINQRLEVVNAQESDNGSSYQCIISGVSSRVAVLVVTGMTYVRIF